MHIICALKCLTAGVKGHTVALSSDWWLQALWRWLITDRYQNNCPQSHRKRNVFLFFCETNFLGQKQLVKCAEYIHTALTYITQSKHPHWEKIHHFITQICIQDHTTYYMTWMPYHFTLSVTLLYIHVYLEIRRLSLYGHRDFAK